jgi:hypothetical protein
MIGHRLETFARYNPSFQRYISLGYASILDILTFIDMIPIQFMTHA